MKFNICYIYLRKAARRGGSVQATAARARPVIERSSGSDSRLSAASPVSDGVWMIAQRRAE